MQTGDIIRIINWKKFNPRNDVKNPSWFRIPNSIFDDSDFFSLNHGDKVFLIYLLCLASRKQSEEVRLNLDHATRLANFKSQEIDRAINQLCKFGFISVKIAANDEDAYANVTYTLRTRHAREEEKRKEEKRNKCEKPPAYSQEFEFFWQLYQREGVKGDKRKSFDDFKAMKLGRDDQELLKTAIKNYMQSTDSKYRKHFERFLKLDWRELGSINTVALLTRQELLDRGFDPDNINHPLLKLKE